MPNHLNFLIDDETEQAVLGCILIDNALMQDAIILLEEDYFHLPAHQFIYSAFKNLHESGKRIDSLIVGDLLKSKDKLEASGSYSYIDDLKDNVRVVENFHEYISILKEKRNLRRINQLNLDIQKELSSNPTESEDLIRLLQERTLQIEEQSSVNQTHFALNDILKDYFGILEKRSENESDITGLPTGFKLFDKLTTGLNPSDLVILAARPAMGKTALALNMATNAKPLELDQEKANILIFSLEMSKEQLVQRLLSIESEVNSQKLKTGNLESEDWDKLTSGIEKVKKNNILIDDRAGHSIEKISAKAKRIARNQKLDLIVIDYLQLVATENKKTYSRDQEVSYISRSLKILAKDIDVPILALSQLNRAAENRADQRPRMSDLRESGAIEQDADLIMFIYRDEVYNENTLEPGIAEILISKNRSGPIGKIKLGFKGEFTKFYNLSDRV